MAPFPTGPNIPYFSADNSALTLKTVDSMRADRQRWGSLGEVGFRDLFLRYLVNEMPSEEVEIVPVCYEPMPNALPMESARKPGVWCAWGRVA
jgi:hypothetical protein